MSVRLLDSVKESVRLLDSVEVSVQLLSSIIEASAGKTMKIEALTFMATLNEKEVLTFRSCPRIFTEQ